MKTLRDLFLAEMKDPYDADHRMIKALPKLAGAAACEKLKAAFLATWKKPKDR
jgi:ferritin-like metal-binding protein YciE